MTDHVPELIDHIISFLDDDRETVKACSLVCKNWLPSSQYSLFGRLGLESSTLQSFIELLNSPVSTIPNRVHTLDITLSETRFFDTIAPYLNRFTIRTLLLVGDYQWEPICRELEEDVSMWFSGIRVLHLELEFSSPDHYFGLIASFRSLETLFLHFGPLEFRLGDLQRIHSFTFPPHLRTLQIELASKQPLLSWLVPITQFPPISTVRLSISNEELRGIQILLQTLGPSIHSLDLDFYFSGIIDEINRFIDLTHNTNLRSLHLCIRLDTVASRTSIPQVVSQVSLHLTEIELEVLPLNFKDIYCIDWGQLGQVLVQHQFASLRIVRIVITSFDARFHQRWVDEVRKGMSGLDRRGILDITAQSITRTR